MTKSNTIIANMYFAVFAWTSCCWAGWTHLNTCEYLNTLSVHSQLRSSQTINTNIFYLWKPPGASRQLPFHISWPHLILDVMLFPVCTPGGFCHQRTMPPTPLNNSYLFIFIVLGDVWPLTDSSQDCSYFHTWQLWAVAWIHSLIFHTACVRVWLLYICVGWPHP